MLLTLIQLSRFIQSVAIISATLALLTQAAAAEPDIPAVDTCGHVPNRTVRALIASSGDNSFSVESSQTEAGKLTCVWTASKTGGAGSDATLTMDLYHFPDAARAKTELRGFGAMPHPPQQVQTDDTDDEVIQLSPGMQAARHGVEVAVAQAMVPQSISGRPGWAAQLEALTLAGSGAQLPASPLPPGTASTAPSQPAAPEAWHPPPRVLPASSAVFIPIVHVMWRLTHWRFEFVAVAMVSSLILGGVAAGLRRFVVLWLVPIVVGYAFVNLIDGPDLVVGLIYRFGTPAPATVTGTFPTNDVYNNQDVVGFNVLIHLAEGPIAETSFRNDDFNVYPPRNETRYPDQGDIFTVRYLRGHPDDFIIVRGDGSPWANRLRCKDLETRSDQADQKARFAPNDLVFRQAVQAAHAALQSAACQGSDSSD